MISRATSYLQQRRKVWKAPPGVLPPKEKLKNYHLSLLDLSEACNQLNIHANDAMLQPMRSQISCGYTPTACRLYLQMLGGRQWPEVSDFVARFSTLRE